MCHLWRETLSRKQDIMVVHVLREYNVNKVFLSRLGLWPFQSKLKRNMLSIFFLVLEISFIPFEILLLYDHRDDIQIIFESGHQLGATSVFVVKLWNGIWNRDKFRLMYEAINDHWNIFTNDLEVRILKDYSTISRKFTIFYSTMMYFATSIFIVVPLTPAFLNILLPLNESRSPMFAINVEFKVDTEKYFVPIFCYTTVAIVVGISVMIGFDTMQFTCYTHACSLFSIIGEQIGNITSKLDTGKCGHYSNKELELSNEEAIYQQYIICIQKYQLALKFVDILHSVYQTVSVYLLLWIIATLSLVGARIVYALDQLGEITRLTFVIIGMLTQLLLLCYSGQKLIDESQNVFYRAYAAEWYQFSPKLKSLLIITLYRSFIPCGLTAKTMVPLSMTTAATVIRVAVSYFTTLLSFKD